MVQTSKDGHDPCTGLAKGLKDSVMTLEKAGYHDIEVITYANSRHEVLNDNDASKVYHDVINWLDAKA